MWIETNEGGVNTDHVIKIAHVDCEIVFTLSHPVNGRDRIAIRYQSKESAHDAHTDLMTRLQMISPSAVGKATSNL